MGEPSRRESRDLRSAQEMVGKSITEPARRAVVLAGYLCRIYPTNPASDCRRPPHSSCARLCAASATYAARYDLFYQPEREDRRLRFQMENALYASHQETRMFPGQADSHSSVASRGRPRVFV